MRRDLEYFLLQAADARAQQHRPRQTVPLRVSDVLLWRDAKHGIEGRRAQLLGRQCVHDDVRACDCADAVHPRPARDGCRVLGRTPGDRQQR